MSEVLLEFSEPVSLPGGLSHQARICGREGSDGLWEGWIEFQEEVDDESDPLPSPIESRQPDRERLLYWATGLTYAYLQGALARAIDRARAAAIPPAAPSPRPRPATLPADHVARPPRPRANGMIAARAVIDPFEVYAQGEDVLRRELNALSADHLRNVIAAYNLGAELPAEIDREGASSRAVLAQAIVQAVKDRVRANGAGEVRSEPTREARSEPSGEARP